MSANTRPPPPANGVITEPARVGGNRKKQKRRAKQAAKNASQTSTDQYQGQSVDVGYDEEPVRYEDEDEDDSDADIDAQIDHRYVPQNRLVANGIHPPPSAPDNKKSKKKNRKSSSIQPGGAHDPQMLQPLHRGHGHAPGSGAVHSAHRGHHQGNIWNTSTQQERQNIKEFWLSLSEEERKGLLKIEKEAVLKKMKQQQKHSCSCTVCGRKRTAIEEELEVLYEGYYEELEQYAHHDAPPGLPSADGMVPHPLQHRPHPLATPPPPLHPPQHQHPHHRTSHMQEHLDDEEEHSSDDDYEEDEEEEEYSDEEEEEYSDEEDMEQPEPPRGHPGVPDFFNFGSHLTVKGILTPWVEKLREGLKGNADNLLTVADDLLKNDGRKFIEMMEQLAERRMAREQRSQYEADTHSGYPPGDPAYDHEDTLAAEDEYDDDEASYDSQDEYDDEMEEDEMGGLTEEQRMQEGRRMFQIFAARMFEQRVLTAYREKVAAERQQKLLEELEDEGKLQKEREAKKQRDAQKKKDKKKQQQLAKAEEKAKRDAEKAEEEARLREAEEKKQEEQRRKKEEQRRKREEEKKRQEEEKARKEAERLRRQQEEQQRREEAERKAREQKAAEKARKEEQRKREREEREAREREARERKAQEEKEKKEREAKAKAEKEVKERDKSAQQFAHPPQNLSLSKRPSQASVAIPGVYGKQTASGISSPHPSIATPALPKAPTPNKPRQQSQQGSHASSPKQSQSQLSSAPSKSSSPGNNGTQQAQVQSQVPPKHILQKPNNQHSGQQLHQAQPSLLMHQHIQPPPGMPHPQHHLPAGFGGPPMGFPGFPLNGPMGMGQRGQLPLFPQHHPQMGGFGGRMGFPPSVNGMPAHGMMPPHGRGFPFDNSANMNLPPPGFGPPPPHLPNQTSPIGQPPSTSDAPRQSGPAHSRQHSSDKERFESAANQPIQRPAPIQRPSSVRPQGLGRNGYSGEVDDLSNHLGSSALLDDSDEPIPTSAADARRQSKIAPAQGINIPGANVGPLGPGFGAPVGGFGAPGSSWNNTPAVPFGASPSLSGQQWGGFPPSNSWSANNTAFTTNGGFGTFPGSMNRPGGVGHHNRPLIVRQSMCNACRQLSAANRGEGDEYHDADTLIRHMMSSNPALESPPTLEEVEVLCGTEGNSQNGGGELHIRRNESDGSYAVKWTADASTPDQNHRSSGLGEIGSPMPSKTSPVGGFGGIGIGRGFSNIGAIGSPST